MSDGRLHRPPLERTGPDRGIGNIWGRAGASPGPDDAAGEAFEATGDFVGEGVRVAYEVVEAYLRQGQKMAQQFGRLSYGPLTMASNLPELQARWLQVWTDLAASWFDMLGLWTEAMVPLSPRQRNAAAPWPEPPNDFGPAPPDGFGPAAPNDFGPVPPSGVRPPPAAGGPRVAERPIRFAYEIASARPALVHAEFYPGRETLDLVPTDLRSQDSRSGTIDVVFEPRSEERRVVVRVAVPREQEAGLYTGALLCAADGSMVGGISLRLR